MLRRTLVAAAVAVVAVFAATPAYADNVRVQQWHLNYLKIAQAQQIAQGAGVTVAVIDSGVADHQDLSDNVLDGTDVVPGGAGNGRSDSEGHGTGMAGLIAAHGHGAGGKDGALGIAPKAKILPITITTAKYQGQDQPMADAIRYAMAHGAKIINISQDTGDLQTLRAVNDAQAAGVLIFAAAGNTDQGDTAVSSPARYPWVVAVAGVDKNGNHAPTSVAGAEVELAAPGVDIVTTGLKGIWRKGTGTSDATAIVSGVAALVWSKFPNLSAAEVLHRIEATAVDKGPAGRDPQFGYGVVDPVAALTADVPSSASPSAQASSPLPTLASPPADALPDSGGSGDSKLPLLLAVAGGAVVLIIILVIVAVAMSRSRRRPPPPSAGPPWSPGR
ncbi:type VII secretion-associated serine protease mycosin [Hamadaea tsunoensis]|uniref:type VII secretion-associated serine protease mycosin n=1 Tax=Hamadaea tsunoensis TaxID=53368 RepID=UPI0004179448|nr:type VII secretion-associated serine protease mycosin [Hamadaea tsunoensis]